MSRVTSLTAMSDRDLNRWIKRIALILVIGAIAFAGFYIFDRWRMPSAPIVDRELAAAETAVQADPADIAARGQLADLYVAKGRYEDAIAQYDAILESGKETELAHFGRANAYQGLGELDKAAADFQAVVDIAKGGEMASVDPLLNAAYYGLGKIALDQGRVSDAVTSLESAAKIRPADADTLALLGKAYVANGDNEKAIEVLERAASFVPLGWSDPYETLAQAYAATGDTGHAEWASAMAELSRGETDAAKTRLEALTDGPLALDAAIGLGLVYESKGDSLSAAEWYQKALDIDPQSTSARLGLGRVVDASDASPAPAASPIPSLPLPGDLPGGNG